MTAMLKTVDLVVVGHLIQLCKPVDLEIGKQDPSSWRQHKGIMAATEHKIIVLVGAEVALAR